MKKARRAYATEAASKTRSRLIDALEVAREAKDEIDQYDAAEKQR